MPRTAMLLGCVLLLGGLAVAAYTLLHTPGGTSAAALPTPSLSSAAPSPSAGGVRVKDPLVPGREHVGEEGLVIVHVAGAVVRPGIVRLAEGARVAEAIEAAGGALAEADLNALNLAAVVSDGEQIRVPLVGEAAQPQSFVDGGAARTGSSTQGGGSGGLINLNTADAQRLEELPGIGPSLARRIVEYRDAHGPFGSVDDLLAVPGIGASKFESLRGLVSV